MTIYSANATNEHGNWRIDPERDALRMANHTRVFHHSSDRLFANSTIPVKVQFNGLVKQ